MDNFITDIVRLLKSGREVVDIGPAPASALDSGWIGRATNDVVMTRTRREHYLARHPEIAEWEHDIIRAILDPDEVHLYAERNDGANFVRRLDQFREGHYVVVCLAISSDSALSNSVLSSLIVRSRAVRRRRERGLLRWEREG